MAVAEIADVDKVPLAANAIVPPLPEPEPFAVSVPRVTVWPLIFIVPPAPLVV